MKWLKEVLSHVISIAIALSIVIIFVTPLYTLGLILSYKLIQWFYGI